MQKNGPPKLEIVFVIDFHYFINQLLSFFTQTVRASCMTFHAFTNMRVLAAKIQKWETKQIFLWLKNMNDYPISWFATCFLSSESNIIHFCWKCYINVHKLNRYLWTILQQQAIPKPQWLKTTKTTFTLPCRYFTDQQECVLCHLSWRAARKTLCRCSCSCWGLKLPNMEASGYLCYLGLQMWLRWVKVYSKFPKLQWWLKPTDCTESEPSPRTAFCI